MDQDEEIRWEVPADSADSRYVDRMLHTMSVGRPASVILRRFEPLPEFPPPPDPIPDTEPLFDSVVNRLKVMCNRDPIQYAKPVKGRLRLHMPFGLVIADVLFDDAQTNASCRIETKEDTQQSTP